MNGMKQGLIIGAVVGLFFGFALGRFGSKQGQGSSLTSDNNTTSAAKPTARRTTPSKFSDLPKNYLRPGQLKGINWSGLSGRRLVWAVKVLNEVPCNCKGSKTNLARCIVNAKRCRPNMGQARSIIAQIKRGVHYTRVLARYAKKKRARGTRRVLRPLPRLAVPVKGIGNYRRYRVPVGKAPTFGSKNALVTIIEFSDFQCPFCTRGARVIDQIKKNYGSKVRVAFRHQPLSFHPQAHIAAQASMAAHAQGKFWKYHDLLFRNRHRLKKANLIRYAGIIGLNVAQFTKDLNSGKYKSVVDGDSRFGRSVGAGGTPTFFINGRRVVGAQPYNKFKQIIDQEIQIAQRLVRSGVRPAQLYGKLLAAAPKVVVRKAPPAPRVNVAVGSAPSFGPKNAKVTIVEFSDFQCPFCNRGARVVDQIKKAYGNKVRVVFKHLPLSFHKQAHAAAQASMAAHEQGKFWAYHDKLFANYRNLNKANFIKWAKELGLDMAKFKAALDSKKYRSYVDKDLIQARKLGARGTPTFFINGTKLVGAQPFARFKSVIDAALSGKAAPTPRPRARRAAPKAVAKIPVGGSPSWGPKNAKVTIVEFSDFQCPFCTRGARTVEQLKKQYAGKLRVVFKHLPLSFHRQAKPAAEASMAAHEQGKFWPYHDKLFANYRNLNKANFIKWAKELNLDMAKFKAALDSGKYKKFVENDLALARRSGAGGTPTFFINGIKLVGAQPISRFKSIIDAILSGKKPPAAAPRRPRRPQPTGPVKIKLSGKEPSSGPANAKITIVEFSDFQCPFCKRGAATVEQIKKAYKGKVRVVFRHLPLSFHRNAKPAAEAAMAAHEQGKFWAYHDKLFANYRNLNKANYIKWAKELGLDMAKFKAAINSGKYRKYVENDAAAASRLGARGTPTFFINGNKLVGAQPFARFKQVIDAVLAGKKIPSRARRRPSRPKPTGPVKIKLSGKEPSWGPKDAKITIVEFSDFQCPFCNRGARNIEQLKKLYKGKLRVVFRHLPLSFHKQAKPAAEAAMAAHEQGKFWAYHDKLFANYRNLNKANFIKWAKELNLDMAKFNAAINSGKYRKYVENDAAAASRLGARGTPTFFINGNKLVGAQPVARFKQVIDALLAGKKMPSRAPRRARRPQPTGPVKINLTGKEPSWGPKNAKVTIVEFSDFQCPFCTRGARNIEQLKKLYKGKLRVVFRHLPLSFHKQAKPAAEAAMAAHEQGKFWAYHDKLFANYRNLNKANFIKWAKELGLDMDKFKAAINSGKYRKYVENDAAAASRLGARGTPTFFINGNKLVGAQPVARFKQVIDALLAGKKMPSRAPRRARRPQPTGPVKIKLSGKEPSFGPANAKVTIVEFSDFQCPFCTRGANTIKKVMKEYAGKVRVVFKHLPLSFHRQAKPAAQAAMAAHEQGKFWAYHDKLFANYRNLNKANFIKWAQELGLDMAKFKAALNSGKYKNYVNKDAAEASRYGARGTPTFFINGKRLVGAQPFSRFKSMIDAELKK